jgi:hypothetical protein
LIRAQNPQRVAFGHENRVAHRVENVLWVHTVCHAALQFHAVRCQQQRSLDGPQWLMSQIIEKAP